MERISRQAAHRKDSRLRRATTATIPRQAGNDSPLTLQAKREKKEKRETSEDMQIGKRGNRPYRAGRAAAEGGKRARTV